MRKHLLSAVIFVLAFSFNLKAQEFSITIDAEKDAFYETLTGQSDGLVYLPSRSFLDESGFSSPDNDDDISAIIWFAYDEDFLYCYMEAKDDFITASNSSRFLNDCIEIKFDPDPNAGVGTATSNLRMTALGVDDAEDPNGVDNLNGSGHLESATGNDLVVIEDDYARRFIDGGYALEFRVPFEYINEMEDNRFMVERIVDNYFGMAINLGDNDSGTRDHMLQWSAGHADAAHSDASLHGTATFLDGNKLKLEAISPRDSSIVNDSADVWYSNPNTDVELESNEVKSFQLYSGYPNPFNPGTTIKFSIAVLTHVTLEIYNSLGEKVAQLISQDMNAGVYSTVWNAANFTSGVYYYRLTAGKFSETKKLILLK